MLGRPLRLLGILGLYSALTAGLYVAWLVVDPSAGGEARRDMKKARSPGCSTVCSSTAFQA